MKFIVLLAALLIYSNSIFAAQLQCQDLFLAGRTEPISRFETRLSRLNELLPATLSPDQVINSMNSESVRAILLQLQGLAKIYELSNYENVDLTKFSEFRAEVKEFEDHLGTYMRRRELLKHVIDTQVSPKVLAAIETEVIRERDILKSFMLEKNWLPNPAKKILFLEKQLQEVTFPKKKEDQKMRAKGIIKLIKHYRSSIENLATYIYKPNYNEADLEAGLHSFRRELRWVILAIGSSDGQFYNRPPKNSSPELQQLESSYGQSKYLDMAPPQVDALQLNRQSMLILTKLVDQLGRLKDFKESQLDLVRALKAAKSFIDPVAAQKFAYDRMADTFGLIDVELETRKLYEFYLQSDPLKELLNTLKRQID
ncbi:MAG: hypothetical protein H7061_07515 [Bdellovibrionaceae bacterium]|nr:hypothetical protein [Bdellovibrio sp.]